MREPNGAGIDYFKGHRNLWKELKQCFLYRFSLASFAQQMKPLEAKEERKTRPGKSDGDLKFACILFRKFKTRRVFNPVKSIQHTYISCM